MEHIVQFAVGIDDKAITDRITETAEKQIVDSIRKDVINKLFQPYYYRETANPERDPLSNFSEKILRTFLDENKEAILDRASRYLAEKLARSKAGKEILEDMANK